jgi:hypothetical protein
MWLPMWVFDGNGFTMACLAVWIRNGCPAWGTSAMTMRSGAGMRRHPMAPVNVARMSVAISGTDFTAPEADFTAHPGCWLGHLEKVIHPRWHTPLEATERLVGAVVVILSTTLHTAKQRRPASVIALISLTVGRMFESCRDRQRSKAQSQWNSAAKSSNVIGSSARCRPTVQHGRAYHRLLLLQIEPRRRLARTQESLPNATTNQIRSSSDSKVRKEPSR